MARRKTLDKWIAEAIADPDKDSSISAITLFHMRGQQPIELHTWKAAKGNQADAKQLADMFQDKAHTYAQDLEGTQMFNLCAFYGKSTPEAQMPFAVRVEADIHASGLSTEPPTETGRMQQTMRWAEMQQGQVYRRQQIMDDHSIRMIEQQSRMIEALMQDRFQAANVVVDMIMRQTQNAHELQMRQLEFQRTTEERQALMKLAPALVNTLTGKEVFPQPTADSALIDTIANELTEEHLGKIMEMGLPDTILAPLAHRVMQAREKKAQEEAAKKALPAYRGDPADDVKGGKE